jgi:CRISPR/Cas system-associated exonuclease Cas4 (RecB family)
MSLVLDVHPNEVAMKLMSRDYISYSCISAYQSCPLKWSYRYVLGIPETTVSSSLAFGSAIHQCAELHFRELMAGNAAPDLDMLLYEYHAAWLGRDLDTIKFGKGEDVNTLSALAERVLVAFMESPLATPAGNIVGVEEELRGPVAEDCPDLLARIDLMVDAGDALEVIDLKTSRSRWTQNQADNSGEQLLLYSVLAQELMPEKPVRLKFLVVTKTKVPVVEAYSVTCDPARVERTRRVLRRTWQAICAGRPYPAPSPMSCGGCSFREPCRQWQG